MTVLHGAHVAPDARSCIVSTRCRYAPIRASAYARAGELTGEAARRAKITVRKMPRYVGSRTDEVECRAKEFASKIRTSFRTAIVIKFLGFVLTGVIGATAAQANTYFVSKPNDTFDGACDSDCSLREAVHAANLRPGPDNIRLGAGTYTLTRPNLRELDDAGDPVPAEDPIHESDNVLGDLNLKDDLSIVAPFGAGTTVSGGGLDRVFEVLRGVTFTANNLTITGGVASESGGGLYNAGTTTLTNSVVIGNHAAGFRDSGLRPHRGGGILNVAC